MPNKEGPFASPGHSFDRLLAPSIIPCQLIEFAGVRDVLAGREVLTLDEMLFRYADLKKLYKYKLTLSLMSRKTNVQQVRRIVVIKGRILHDREQKALDFQALRSPFRPGIVMYFQSTT